MHLRFFDNRSTRNSEPHRSQMKNRHLIERIEEIDPDLADEVLETIRHAESRRSVQDAREHLSDTCALYSHDLTGQDGEDEKNAAASDYIDAQDAHIRDTDPDRWSEMQMGA